ncbi:hypothetical protein EVAR_3305_1 [Eumeta japonica]|uniref:Uncharacterized protein n=1 Tax=Eumeta variegata TaxID=151549 RepID=A0A4C1SV14_EUMVA|nr:hypothetical protein EVAR_3305_1 [Eumeta japonica]
MQRFVGDDSNAVYDMVIGNENWVYCYHLVTTRQSAQWVFLFEELTIKVKQESRPVKEVKGDGTRMINLLVFCQRAPKSSAGSRFQDIIGNIIISGARAPRLPPPSAPVLPRAPIFAKSQRGVGATAYLLSKLKSTD